MRACALSPRQGPIRYGCNAAGRCRDQPGVPPSSPTPRRSPCRSLSRAPARSGSCSPSPSPLLGAVAPSAMAHAARRRSTRRPTTPPATPCSASTAHADGSLSPAGIVRDRRRRPRRRSAGARAPSSSAATAATCTRSTPAPTASPCSASAATARTLGTVPSRGVAPTSIDEHRGRVYVLNSGGTPSVAAFCARVRRLAEGDPGGTRALAPGAVGAAQVSVTPDGRSLVVSERLANRLETLPLDRLGRPGAPVVTAVERRGAVRLRDHPAGHARRLRGRGQHRLVVPPRRGRRAAHHHRPRCRSARARPAGSRCRRTGASPTRATPAAASAASRSRVTALSR